MVNAGTTHAQMREASADDSIATPERRAAAEALLQRLLSLRDRCRRHTGSFVTPMGNEMYYRYQQSLIDEAITTLGALLKG